MAARDDLPALPPHAAWLLAGLIGVVWVALRVGIVRRREAGRAPEEPPVAARWLRRLAAWRGTNALLAALAAVLLLAVVYVLR